MDTPRLLTNSSGQIAWRARYEAFGNALIEADPDGNGTPITLNVRFPGQYFDSETGLHYNYFRQYDPTIGRYAQSDPIGIEGGTHLYVYVRNRTTSMIDPLGLLASTHPCPRLTWPEHCVFVPDSDKVYETRTSEQHKIQEGEKVWFDGELPGWEPSQDLPSPISIGRRVMPNPGLQSYCQFWCTRV